MTFVGCTNVMHNAVDCAAAELPIDRFCKPCRQQQSGLPYVAAGKRIMQGRVWRATAASHTLAKRIANALNSYTPNREGV
jgi:hypothetical protein